MLVDHLLKNKERIQKFKERGDTSYDMAYGDFKDLAKRTTSDTVLRDKAFNIAKIPKYDGYQRGLASIIYKFFDKKSAGSGVTTQNQQLAEEFILHLKIIFAVLI